MGNGLNMGFSWQRALWGLGEGLKEEGKQGHENARQQAQLQQRMTEAQMQNQLAQAKMAQDQQQWEAQNELAQQQFGVNRDYHTALIGNMKADNERQATFDKWRQDTAAAKLQQAQTDANILSGYDWDKGLAPVPPITPPVDVNRAGLAVAPAPMPLPGPVNAAGLDEGFWNKQVGRDMPVPMPVPPPQLGGQSKAAATGMIPPPMMLPVPEPPEGLSLSGRDAWWKEYGRRSSAAKGQRSEWRADRREGRLDETFDWNKKRWEHEESTWPVRDEMAQIRLENAQNAPTVKYWQDNYNQYRRQAEAVQKDINQIYDNAPLVDGKYILLDEDKEQLRKSQERLKQLDEKVKEARENWRKASGVEIPNAGATAGQNPPQQPRQLPPGTVPTKDGLLWRYNSTTKMMDPVDPNDPLELFTTDSATSKPVSPQRDYWQSLQ